MAAICAVIVVSVMVLTLSRAEQRFTAVILHGDESRLNKMKASFEISATESLPWEGNPEVALQWVAARLSELGLASECAVVARAKKSTLDVTVFEQRYRLSGLNSECLTEAMTLRLHRASQLIDRLLGRPPFDSSDAFARVLQDMLEREAALVAAKVYVLWR